VTPGTRIACVVSAILFVVFASLVSLIVLPVLTDIRRFDRLNRAARSHRRVSNATLWHRSWGADRKTRILEPLIGQGLV
jgi:hypothetical protein